MNSTSSYDVVLHGIIGVEYALYLDAPPRSGASCQIERETREAGGTVLLTALELAKRGVRVALCGNPIGDDSNGRLIMRALEHQPNLTCLASSAVPSFETPYWVSLRAHDEAPAILSRIASTVDFDRTSLQSPANTRLFADDGFWPEATSLWEANAARNEAHFIRLETRGIGSTGETARLVEQLSTLLNRR